MTAAYEQVSLGLFLMPEPLPGARAVEGKMRVLITTLTPEEAVTTQLAKLFRGQELDKTKYAYAHELSLESSQPFLAQIDGDIYKGKRFEISCDRTMKFIVPQ